MSWEKYLSTDRLRPSNRDIKGDPRNEFDSDFGRIIFSPATRRMHDKTQVFPLTSDDNIHSRLTHSMEVMSVGHSLGLQVCKNEAFLQKINQDECSLLRQIPVLLKNACLVHDIGNPPFGHFGETVIKKYFEIFFKRNEYNLNLSVPEKEDFIYFDGNAQGFRVLTKLQILDDTYGLNLTYATLGAFLKYPNAGEIQKNSLSLKKRGVFQSEKKYLESIGEGCGMTHEKVYKRHPLAFLMEAADSICYLAMDIEDGYNKGWYDYSTIKQTFTSVPGFKEKFEKLDAEHTGYGSETAKTVNFRIYVIRNLIQLAVKNFIDNIDFIIDGSYNKELITDGDGLLDSKLREFINKYIFPKREIQSLELTGHSVISGLLNYYTQFILGGDEAYLKRALGMISDSVIRIAFLENKLTETDDFMKLPDYYKLRVIVDFISGMTDQFALDHFQKLSGQKII
jgi:dGTPase